MGAKNCPDFLPLNMGPIGFSKTSVINYRYSLRNNPEERSTHLLSNRSEKSLM